MASLFVALTAVVVLIVLGNLVSRCPICDRCMWSKRALCRPCSWAVDRSVNAARRHLKSSR